MKFIVIGITDHPKPFLSPEVLEIIKAGEIFSGGKRHHEIVAPLLPADAEWIDITAPLDAVFEKYASLKPLRSTQQNVYQSKNPLRPIIVFASGDPLFFGFANTIKRKMPDAEIVTYPTFNSLQMLAHRLVMPYHDMRIVSLTGRPWPEFDRALIERVEKIGILTDRTHTPSAIAQRMLDYHYSDYTMYVGEHLGNPLLEKVSSLTLEEATLHDFEHPNCVIVAANLRGQIQTVRKSTLSSTAKPFGIPDSAFDLLDGREKMITKMPIRLLTLQALDLPKRKVFWDIGFCTGSISIEARLLFPHLHIEAFEIRPECEAIINENARRFGAPGIEVHIGDFLSVCCDDIAANGTPDAVFIGGHGGRLKDIMAKVLTVLAPDGVIVFNSVTSAKIPTNSHLLWDEACSDLGLTQETPLHIQLNDNNPIDILKATQKK